MRVVLDTNVLLAGLATHGLCEALLLLCYRDHLVILSDHILSEFAQHYADKFKAGGEQTAMVVATLRAQSEIVTPAKVAPNACADPDDLPVLGTAIAGRADCLITGDQQLLAMGEYQGAQILSPRAFYDRLRA